jgi:gentisate 1,2-dioxygenase
MRSSENAVYSVVEGCGSVVIGEQRFDFRPHDTFVVPSWEYCRFETPESCVLFSYSDRAAQQALGLLREERAA